MSERLRQWLDVSPVLPPRSILLRPEPIGLGTPDGESLPSYIARLADLHGLWPGKLAELLVLPRLTTRRIDSLRQRFAGRSPALGGLQQETRDWLDAFSALTQRDDLGATTAQTLGGLVASTGLLRRGGVCPACLFERREAGLIYESLAWLLAPLSVCPRHRLGLLVICQACGRDLVSLTWRSRVGYCPRCGAFLGDQATPVDQDEQALWTATEVGRLVSLLPELNSGRITTPSAAAAVRSIVDAAGGAAPFRQHLGLASSRIGTWTRAIARPELGSLIAMSRVAGMGLLDVVSGSGAGVAGSGTTAASTVGWRLDRRRRIDWTSVAASFAREAQAPDPSPVVAMCRRARVDPAQARMRIPVEYAVLKEASASARARRSAKRRLRLLAAVERAVAEARSGGRAPSRRAVEERLPKGVSLREGMLGDHWRELLRAA